MLLRLPGQYHYRRCCLGFVLRKKGCLKIISNNNRLYWFLGKSFTVINEFLHLRKYTSNTYEIFLREWL